MPHQPLAPTHAYLRALMAERNQHPERATDIDARVVQTFERTVAILVLDMCGFSRLTAEHGIIHFLALLHQMEQAAVPAVQDNGGTVIKAEADNLFAIFAEPAHALEAALDIFRAFEAINAVTPESRHLRGSIGIGYGPTLVIENSDLFGCEMNLASKLGEDIAGPREILLTCAAFDALPAEHYQCTAVSHAISGLDLPFHRFQDCLRPYVRAKVTRA